MQGIRALTLAAAGSLSLAQAMTGSATLWATLAVAPARAQAPEPTLTLLPTSELTGDGLTPVSLYLLALDGQGAPLEGLVAKVKIKEGEAGEWASLGGGLYRLPWTPPIVEMPAEIPVKIKAQTADKTVSVELAGVVPVEAPMRYGMSVATEQRALLATARGPVSIKLETVGRPVPADVQKRMTGGELSEFVDLFGGRFATKWTPPAGADPHLLLLTMADRRAPDRVYGHAVLPVDGTAEVKVRAKPGQQVLVTVGDREFGPVEAAARGDTIVPVEVGPGDRQATVRVITDAGLVDFQQELRHPVAQQVQLFPNWVSVPSDGSTNVPVRALLVDADGAPLSSAKPDFAVSLGKISEPRHEGAGVYVATWTPPLSPIDDAARVAVLLGQDSVQRGLLDVALLRARPREVLVQADPAVLPVGQDTVRLRIEVKDSEGRGMPGQNLALRLTGAKQVGATKDLKDGSYTAELQAAGKGPIAVVAHVLPTAGGNPLRHILASTLRDQLPADGLSSAPLLLRTLDAHGDPVANVELDLVLLSGSGQLPARVTTDAHGLAEVYYTAGREAGMVTVKASWTRNWGVISFFEGDAPDLKLPRSGTVHDLELYHSWQPSTQQLWIGRE